MEPIYGNLKILMILALSAIFFASCSEDEVVAVDPTANFIFEVEERTVTFTNTSENAQSYNWNFGDGGTSTEEHPTHTFSQNGTYTIKLTAVGEGGHDLESKEVTVDVPVPTPTADYNFEVEELTVTFTNASENAVSYEWDFGDNNTSTDENPIHTYTAPGTYNVVLTTIGQDGIEAEASLEVTVVNTPTADFTYEADQLKVIFANLSKNATSYAWDFGDGNTSNEQHPTYIYSEEGTYTVVLTATGEDGTEAEASKEVTVELPAGTIVFVTDDSNDNEQIEWLREQNYIVTTYYNSSFSTAPQADIDMLNSADLVIIGRSGSSGDFAGENKIAWNELTAPLILNSQWIARDSRMNWFSNAGDPAAYNPNPSEIIRAQIQEPGDVAFEGVTIGNNLLPWLDTPVNLLYVGTPTSGKVLATGAPGDAESEEGGPLLFVRFDAGIEFYSGAGDAPAGPRTYFGFGADEGGTSYYWQLTDEAKQVYLNEIHRMVESGE